ncbi:hypothetical protein D3C80_1649080 [compost metagenome]
MLDVRQRRFQALDADRTFFQGALHTGAQFFFVEGLAAAVLLDQPGQNQFGGFEGGEALTAGNAFAPTAHLLALGNQSRVDDLGVVGTAEGTVHGGRQQKKGGPW